MTEIGTVPIGVRGELEAERFKPRARDDGLLAKLAKGAAVVLAVVGDLHVAKRRDVPAKELLGCPAYIMDGASCCEEGPSQRVGP